MTKSDTKKSIVLYIGSRNRGTMHSCEESQSELEIDRIRSVTLLNNYLTKRQPDLIILEYSNELSNISSILGIIQRHCKAPIILLAPSCELGNAVVALRNGAYNFIPEPIVKKDLLDAMFDALRMRVLWKEIHETQSIRLTSLGQIIGSAPTMQVLYKMIQNVTGTDATVLIQGARGTGKDLVARAIHDNGPRSEKPFIVVNCGAIPPNLLESEIFGHEKGSFTGAVSRRTGKFEQANKGSLFLDEITELPMNLQVKLLRIIQDKHVVRVGGTDTIPVDVRIICATNRNILEEVKHNRFREDLYYRLNVVPIKTPSLKARRQDIPLLLAHFLNIFAEKYSKYFYEFSVDAIDHLCSYDWPGNVREMENMIERIVVLNEGAVVEVHFLPDEILKTPVIHDIYELDKLTTKASSPHEQYQESETLPLWKVEMEMIRTAMQEVKGNVSEASKLLEIGQATLYRKLKKYGIDRVDFNSQTQ